MTILLIFLSLYVGINIRFSIVSSVIELTILLGFVYYKYRKIIPVIISLLTSLSGFSLSFLSINSNKESYSGFVSEVKENYFIFSTFLEKMYVYEPNHIHEIGDVLSINGDKEELDFVVLESEFDFKEYLNNKGIYHELLVKKIEVKFLTPFKLHKIKKNFLNKFDENSKGIVGQLLFSYGNEGEIISLSRNLHLMKLVSSSGIYLYFFYKLIKKLLSLFIRNEKILDLLSIILLSPYLVFTFPKFAVIKFFLVRSALFINNHALKKKFTYLDILSMSGIFFLLIDFNLARQDNFFLAYFIPIISLFSNGSFHFRKKIYKRLFIAAIIYISFIPFTAKYYSEISPISVLFTPLVTPLYIFIFILGVLSFIGIPLEGAAIWINRELAHIYTFIKPLFLKIYVSPMDNALILLYEIIFILLLYFISIRLRPIKNLFAYSLTFLLVVYVLPINNIIHDYVCFINVGQGDSTLIKYKNKTVLIDTGGVKYKDLATSSLIPFFKKKQIYTIDLLITTHEDFDHSGAVNSLIENFTVKDYVKDYQKFPINLNGLTLTNYNIYPELWKEENDKSLVVGFKINNYNYLVMGDAPKKIEEAIISSNNYIPCDILKVGHHGSNTSTSEKFIKYLSPKYGIISCGKNNNYGHPHKEVISILRKYKVIIRRTDLESTITF